MASARGGAGLARKLDSISRKVATANVVRVGFLEGATYPAGVRTRGKSQKAKRKAARKSAVVLHVATVAWWNEKGTIRSKPRPFFSNMIAAQSPTWGRKVLAAMKATGYNSAKALALLGTDIKDQLVKAIVDWPADNAPRTVERKGFNKGLIEQGIMQRSVDFEVKK